MNDLSVSLVHSILDSVPMIQWILVAQANRFWSLCVRARYAHLTQVQQCAGHKRGRHNDDLEMMSRFWFGNLRGKSSYGASIHDLLEWLARQMSPETVHCLFGKTPLFSADRWLNLCYHNCIVIRDDTTPVPGEKINVSELLITNTTNIGAASSSEHLKCSMLRCLLYVGGARLVLDCIDSTPLSSTNGLLYCIVLIQQDCALLSAAWQRWKDRPFAFPYIAQSISSIFAYERRTKLRFEEESTRLRLDMYWTSNIYHLVDDDDYLSSRLVLDPYAMCRFMQVGLPNDSSALANWICNLWNPDQFDLIRFIVNYIIERRTTTIMPTMDRLPELVYTLRMAAPDNADLYAILCREVLATMKVSWLVDFAIAEARGEIK